MKKWKASKDPLYRGDDTHAVACPTPTADDSVVRHIMFLEGAGRETPYLSTTERREVGERFSRAGRVWRTSVAVSKENEVNHISNKELLALLKGNGKGTAKWDDASEVMQARRYAEEHSEHLLDFRSTPDPKAATTAIFIRS